MKSRSPSRGQWQKWSKGHFNSSRFLRCRMWVLLVPSSTEGYCSTPLPRCCLRRKTHGMGSLEEEIRFLPLGLSFLDHSRSEVKGSRFNPLLTAIPQTAAYHRPVRAPQAPHLTTLTQIRTPSLKPRCLSPSRPRNPPQRQKQPLKQQLPSQQQSSALRNEPHDLN